MSFSHYIFHYFSEKITTSAHLPKKNVDSLDKYHKNPKEGTS